MAQRAVKGGVVGKKYGEDPKKTKVAAGFPVDFYSYATTLQKERDLTQKKFLQALGPGPIRSATTLLKKTAKFLEKQFPGYRFKVDTRLGVGGRGSISWVGSVLNDRAGRIYQLTIRSVIRRRKYTADGNYEILEPTYTLGIWPAQYGAYPTKEVEKKTKLTMRDVAKLLVALGPEKILDGLGGPLVGKSSVTSLSEVKTFIRGLRTWFALEEDDSGFLFYSTRENGDVGYDEPGRADIQEAMRIRKALLAEYGAGSIQAEVEIVDEWVHITVSLKQGKRASALRVALKKITEETAMDFKGEFLKISPIKAVKMDEAFEVETLEGTMKGKAGDWLAQGIEGERWPIDAAIFEKTYKAKTAAEVGTDTAEIYAISPEALYHLMNEEAWREWADSMWGDSPKDTTIPRDPWQQMQRLIRQHGGAVFQTGADGLWDVKVPGSVSEAGFLPPYNTPAYGGNSVGMTLQNRVAFSHVLKKHLASRYQVRVVASRMKQAGWWQIDPESGKGGIAWGARKKDIPKEDQRYGGDEPADMMSGFLTKLDLIYRSTWGRPAYPEEIKAVFNFVFRPMEASKDPRWPLNEWVDVVAEATGMSSGAIANLPEKKLDELNRYWREYRNSGVSCSLKESFPKPSEEALDEFLHHAKIIVRHTLTDNLRMYDINPEKGGHSQFEVGIGLPDEMSLDATIIPFPHRIAAVRWLALKHQARVVETRMKQAGWWSLEGTPPVDKGGLLNAIPGIDPDQGEHYLGDGPLDARGDFLEKIDEMYRRAWNRPVTPVEIRALFEVPDWVAEEEHDLYGLWPMNQWVDVAAKYMDVPQSVVLSLPEDSLRDARRLWREHCNSGIQAGVSITSETGFPQPTIESLQHFIDHIKASFFFAQRDAVEMVDAVDPDKVKLASDAAHARSVALMKFLSGIAKSLGPQVASHTYVVGGAVRDFVLDRPIKDVDLVVDSEALGGKKNAAWFADQVERAIPTRVSRTTNQYLVEILTVSGSWILDGTDMQGEVIEIANARTESYASGGWKPTSVEPATIEEDVKRRELTYNSLLIRLLDLASGPDKKDIIDLTGCGLRDLEQGIMQCPSDPNKVFSDDPTRMLRIVKFALRYGHDLTPDTLAAIRRNASKLRNAEPDAIAKILAQMVLKESTYQEAIKWLDKLGLLGVLAEMLLDTGGKTRQFRTTMQNYVNSQKMDMVFALMDVGLPLGTAVNFLSSSEQTRVREIALGMGRDEAWEFLGMLKTPGNAFKDKSFQPGLMEKYNATKRQMKEFFLVVSRVTRPLLLADPALAHDPGRLKRLVEQGVEAEMRRAKFAKTGSITGDRSGVGLFIPLPKDLAAEFPSLGDEDTSPPHVTLLYVGPVAKDREAEFIEVLSEVLQQEQGPIRAWTSGIDKFVHPEKDREVFYVPIRFSRDFGRLKDKFRSALTDAGFEVLDSFPLAYNSHTTLAYMEGLDNTYKEEIPVGSWDFDAIQVWGLPKLVEVPFNIPNTKQARLLSTWGGFLK